MKRRAFLMGTAATALAGGIFQRASSAFPGWKAGREQAFSGKANEGQEPRQFFYKPIGGRVGDTIPFFADGKFRIFHLFKADGVRYDTTWHQVSTTDFIHFDELGEMIGPGKPTDQDPSVATGSVIKHEGRYHAFYTGFGRFRETGRPGQGVMHAVSDDLMTWTKIPADTFYAAENFYERNVWRDPYVFWNEDAKEFWMLVAARVKAGPKRRRGCTALCKSKDLSKWEIGGPFWAPSLYYTHECPDLFRMGDWWYLIFSEFSETNQTRYRMSRNLMGPWISPGIDTFDTRVFYAGKTASDGRMRYLFGWSPLRAGASDDGEWEWGGNLIVHQLVQKSNGELAVSGPKTIDRAFEHKIPLDPRVGWGKCDIRNDSIKIDAEGSFSVATLGSMPSRCKVTAKIKFQPNCRGFGLLLKFVDDLDSGYYVRFEPVYGRVVFDRWPRHGDVPYFAGIERHLELASPQPLDVNIICDGTIAEVYVNDETAMSTRMYGIDRGQIGLFVEEGVAIFEQVTISSAEDSTGI